MASFVSVFNHLVLPAELPIRADDDPEAVGSAILHRVSEACKIIVGMGGDKLQRQELAPGWPSIRRTLQTCRGIHGADIEAKALVQDWANFDTQDFFLLYIAKQNAALLLRRTDT
jgi:hypothetical protein